MPRALASRSSHAASVSHDSDHAPEAVGRTAEIVRLPVARMPSRDAFLRAFARLVWATYPAASQWGVCERAASEVGGSADTWERIVGEKTQRPDAYLVEAVKRRAFELGLPIPHELLTLIEIRSPTATPKTHGAAAVPLPTSSRAGASLFDGT